MAAHNKVRFLIAIALAFILTACAPVISDKSLREANLSISFQELQKNPDTYTGKVIILGGRIISTTVKKEETWVEVLQQPLDRQYRPENKDISYGRFIIVFQGFIDPAIYAPYRLITVAGEVTGKKVLPVKEIQYTYPVLSPREHALIKPEDYYDNQPQIHFGFGLGIFR
jgi:outer membrane lipoprotein